MGAKSLKCTLNNKLLRLVSGAMLSQSFFRAK